MICEYCNHDVSAIHWRNGRWQCDYCKEKGNRKSPMIKFIGSGWTQRMSKNEIERRRKFVEG